MKKIKAFTLVELMVTLAVFGILVVMGVPSFTSYTRSNRLVTETNSFVGSINYARSEAVKRRSHVTMCQSNDGATCTDAGWATGWIVFVNTDNDSPAQVDGGEEILRVYGAITTNSSLAASANFSDFITYTPKGFPTAQGEFILCNSSGADSARSITVNRIGRVTLTKDGGTCTPS